ncbi:hypothetical protein GCK32_002291 [Trichostrongylus colubriformis]|uniref:Uncharacterized protein n=1 Tax=Trichostrongylus colubriformis TaxID=6319 RepID=A0AAN8IEA4_TRICO
MLASFMRSGCGPFRYVKTVRADAIVCGLGALIGVPTLFVSIHEIQYSMVVCWVFMFICITATCFNWAINVDMLMAVVVPSRRNAANSWQILLSHLFGDASGPYILGLISDAIRGDDDTPEGHFRSLQISFFLPNVLLILSAVLFFISAYTFVRDQKKFQQEMGKMATIGKFRLPSELPCSVSLPIVSFSNCVLYWFFNFSMFESRNFMIGTQPAMLLYVIVAILSMAAAQQSLASNSSSLSNGTTFGGSSIPRNNSTITVSTGMVIGNSSMPSIGGMSSGSGSMTSSNSSMPVTSMLTGNSSVPRTGSPIVSSSNATSGNASMASSGGTMPGNGSMIGGGIGMSGSGSMINSSNSIPSMMAGNSSAPRSGSPMMGGGNSTSGNSSTTIAGAMPGNGSMTSGGTGMSGNGSMFSGASTMSGNTSMPNSPVTGGTPMMFTEVSAIYGNGLDGNTLSETMQYIFRASNVTATQNVMDLIMCTMAANLNPSTAWKVLIALGGEINTAQRQNYFESVVPRIAGLHRKMNTIVTRLAAMYGFAGVAAQNYSKLIRAMQLSSIVSSALMAAGNNTAQYKQIESIAKELGVMSSSQPNRTMPVSAIMGMGGAQLNVTGALPAAASNATVPRSSNSTTLGSAMSAPLGSAMNATASGSTGNASVPATAPAKAPIASSSANANLTGGYAIAASQSHRFFA